MKRVSPCLNRYKNVCTESRNAWIKMKIYLNSIFTCLCISLHDSVSWFWRRRCFIHGWMFWGKEKHGEYWPLFSKAVLKVVIIQLETKNEIHPFCFLSTMAQVTCGLIYGHFNWKLQFAQVDKWSPCRYLLEDPSIHLCGCPGPLKSPGNNDEHVNVPISRFETLVAFAWSWPCLSKFLSPGAVWNLMVFTSCINPYMFPCIVHFL